MAVPQSKNTERGTLREKTKAKFSCSKNTSHGCALRQTPEKKILLLQSQTSVVSVFSLIMFAQNSNFDITLPQQNNEKKVSEKLYTKYNATQRF